MLFFDESAPSPTFRYTVVPQTVVAMLNTALSTELVSMLRYRNHYFSASGHAGRSVAREFLAFANEELGHADLLAARIAELNGRPDFNPATLLSRSHTEYSEGQSLLQMIHEDLVGERVSIDAYRAMIASLGDHDSTTRLLLEEILAVEERHASELAALLFVHTR